jgi:hypothetical protein
VLDERVGDGLVDQDSASCAALLAGVPVSGCAKPRCRRGQIGVVEDDDWGLAAEFKVYAL